MTINALPRRCALATLISLATLGNTTQAAENTGPNSGNKASPMEEIVVNGGFTTNARLDTATGLGLTLQETPQSVSVMTYQRIADQNLRSLTDVVNNAPGISAKGLDSSRQRFAARGFAIDNYQIDGVPMAWSSGGDAGETQSDMSLYERIEVVRGATGLLTGAGNPSASINLVRKHADSRELTATTRFHAGRWDTYGAMADVGGGLTGSGSVRGRIVASYEDAGSFRDLAGDETTVFYGVVEADITDSTLIRLGASHQDNDPTASTWGGLPTWHSDGSRTDWDRSTTIGTEWSSWASTVENQYLDLIHTFANGWTAKVNVNRNVNEADLLLVYLFGTVDQTTGLGLGASPYNAHTERDQISYSAQLTGAYNLFEREHEFTLGAIDSSQDFDSSTRARTNVAPVGSFFDWDGSYPQPTWGASSTAVDTTIDQTGYYAATRLSLTDDLKIILGSRVADWEQRGASYGAAVNYGDSGVVVPYAGVLYDVTDNHRVYASYTEIFKPQAEQDATLNYLDPIVGESREVGLKSRFFNDALHTTVAYFIALQDNLAQTAGPVVQLPNGDTFQPYRAAEGAESKGFEIEVVGRIADGWDISLSYTDFDVEDANGREVNTDQPHEMLKLYSTYRFRDALDRLTVAGGLSWEGSSYTDTVNGATGEPERLVQDDYTLVSLMARYDLTDNLSAQLNVDNLLDEEYYNQIGFYSQLEYGEPRNFTVSMNYQF
jgi:outer membrane receptor for ferric coprogen and ferric-rhodotorulic acid